MPAAPGPDLCGPFDLLDDRVAARAASAAGDSLETARRRLALERADPGAGLRQALARRGLEPYAWREGLVDFYASDPAAVYDTLAWNATWVKRGLRARVLRRLPPPPARVLCHGDGLGLDCLALARLGYQAAWCDASAPCRRFAAALFADEKADVELAPSPEALPAGAFDAALSLDVLEHCPDPPAEVAGLARRLKPGGLLVVNAPFFLVGPRHPTHLDANRRYSGAWTELYLANGFSPAAGAFLWDPLALRLDGAGARAGWNAALWPARLGALLLGVARLSPAPFAAAEALYGAAARAAGGRP